jgi:quinol monooxygenase YgiN
MRTLMSKKTAPLFLIFMFTATIVTAQERTSLQKGAVITVIHIDVIPKYSDTAISLLNTYAHETNKDKGIKTCKVFQEVGRSNHFTLVEEWRDQPAYDAHVGDVNSLHFRNLIQHMLGGPIDERLHTELK